MSWQAVTLILGLAFICIGAFTVTVCVIAWTTSLETRVETIMAHRQQSSPPAPGDLKLVE